MFDFITVACAVPDVGVADVAFNTQKILEKLDEVKDTTASLICFPELAVTGYTCQDLFNQKTLLDEAASAIGKIARKSREVKAAVVVGAPARLNGQLYNCAFVISRGEVLGIVPKTFLPVTGEFYEKRWFCSGAECDVKEASLPAFGISDSEQTVPVGTDLIFDLGDGIKLGIEICEDLWTPLAPSTFSALKGANLIVNISASNETISKRQYRRQLVSQQSASLLCGYVYVSAGMKESTTDLIFSGHSLVCENGIITAENTDYIDSDYLLLADIDMGKLFYERQKNKSFHDCASLYAGKLDYRTVGVKGAESRSDASYYRINRLPFVPNTRKEREERCLQIFDMQVSGLEKRLEVTKCRPVIGVSGGLDSTLALLVSVKAAERVGLTPRDVVGITMPCFGTSDRTYNNSIKLMNTLGVTAVEIPIKDACIQHFKDIGQPENKYDLTYENSQARERTQVLMDYAGKVGGLVVGTGDLSELALGWCTYNADHMSMYGVNASIPKTLVRWLIDSTVSCNLFPASVDVLKDVLDTPISPELLPPDENGKISQQTEELVGPYALHDFFLYYVLRFGFEPEKIFFLAEKAFDGVFDKQTILKWLKSFYRRFFSQQFKRSCLPDGVKVGSVCLSPRGDWRMPSDAEARIWLERAERINA